MIPRLAQGVEAVPHGSGVRLCAAVPRRGKVQALVARWLRLADRIEVELDDLGAFTVALFDGRDLRQIADAIAARCRLTQREAETCTADFLGALLQRRLVVLDAPAVPSAARVAPDASA